MILTKIILAVTSFSLLYIFYQEEKKTLWYQIVVERPKFGFLIPASFLMVSLLLLFLINPFVFYFLLFLGLSIPFVYSVKKDEVNELAFLNFMFLFVYKYFFYFAIFISSILFLFHAPVEAWIISFLQLEEGISHSMLPSILNNMLKEVDVAKGSSKIVKHVAAEKYVISTVPKALDKLYLPVLKPFAEGINYKEMSPEKRVLWNSAILIKQAGIVSELKGFSSKNSVDKQLLNMGWTERDELLFNKCLPRGVFIAFIEESISFVKPFSENSVQNEMITSSFSKQYPKLSAEEDKNVAKLMTESFKILVEHDSFTDKTLSPTDQLQKVRIDDNQSKLALKIPNGVYIEEANGRLTASKGQDCRFFLLAEVHGSLERPTKGTHDADGLFYGIEGSFEVKYVYFDITSKQDYVNSAINFCQSLENAEGGVLTKFGDRSSISKVFAKEAIPAIDLTAMDYLLQNKFNGSTEEVIEWVHSLNPYAEKFKENGKPIIYFSISSSGKTVIIK